MGTFAEKVSYLNDTKLLIKEAIENKGVAVEEDTPFREYANKIASITPVIEALEVTENGTYEVAKGIDGYGPVVVNVPTGGGEDERIPESIVFTGSCSGLFQNNRWEWAIDVYGNRMSTSNITVAQYMFANTALEKIPFDINIANNCTSLQEIFREAVNLTEVPLIKGNLNLPTGDYSGPVHLGYMFRRCYNLREIPYDYFHNFGGEEYWAACKNYAGTNNRSYLFNNCCSLRELPDISMLPTKNSGGYYSSLYYGLCEACYVLNKIVDLPVCAVGAMTSNFFGSTFSYCHRVNNIIFETNEDGGPIVVEWKNQTINLAQEVGYGPNLWNNELAFKYNSGITRDKFVTDDATYQALKDDPDWFTQNVAYSRYNHDSAVATINSLPDTSAYLATAGGSNTIKFKGDSGFATDGGAINLLTEEEIAVATAKGWTVTLT